MSIYVVKGNGASLLGHDTLKRMKLDWNTVYKVDSDINKLLKQYPELFSSKLGKMKNFQAKINVKEGAIPKFCKARNVPFALQDAVKLELDRLENEGIIRSIPHSEWASPIVLVPKPDGSIRLCADYKHTVNPQIISDQYPLPTAEELFAKMKGGEMFSKLDLKNAYLQVELEANSRKYLVINTIKGLKEFTRMPYGVTSASAIFQRKLENALSTVPMTVVKIDDILISGTDEYDHLKNLSAVFDILSKLGLTLNENKCKFFQPEVEYLGFILHKTGIRANPDKIKSILAAPAPTNITELQSFLGGINYYGKFLPRMAHDAAPLYKLLRKEVDWNWSENQQGAFEKLKAKLTSSPILTLYDPKLPIKLACDASSYGVGAVLSHVFSDGSEHPIGYASRTLNKHEKMYSQLDKEGVSIIFGLKKFHQYLYGRRFTIITDNKALSHIFGDKTSIPTLAAARLVRWTVMLCAYDYKIEFRTTKEHANADMLSRLPLPLGSLSKKASPNAINAMQIDFLPITSEQIRDATKKDRVLKLVLSHCLNGEWPEVHKLTPELRPYYEKRDELSIENGVILWGLRVVIPLKYRSHIMGELHSSHPGMVRMKALSRIHVWFPHIDKCIEETVRTCTNCTRLTKCPTKAYIHPWSWPARPFDRVHIDFFGSFYGKNYIILVDSHSKWMEIEIVRNTNAVHTIAILRKWFSQFGVPIQLVSDNGPQFTSSLFKTFTKMNGIKHVFSSAYHPSSNGGAERFVQTVKRGLKALNIEKGDAELKLSNYLLGYRSTPTTTTGRTPSELFLGRNVRTRLDLMKPNLQERMTQYETKMETYQQKRRQPVREFQEGEKVLVQNIPNSKSKWIEGTIIKQISDRTYIVDIGHRNIKRHIDHLVRNHANVSTDTEDSDNFGDIDFNVTNQSTNGNNSHPEVLRKFYPRRQREPVKRYGLCSS